MFSNPFMIFMLFMVRKGFSHGWHQGTLLNNEFVLIGIRTRRNSDTFVNSLGSDALRLF
jgi:hypothetical protein